MDDNPTKTRFEDDDHEIELELCLSIGGSLRKIEKSAPIENCIGDKRDEQSVVDEVWKDLDANLGGACVDSLSNREIHALRRQKARKKREAKQLQRRGPCGVRNGEFQNGTVSNHFGTEERYSKRIKTESNGSLNGETSGVNLNLDIEQSGCSGRSPVSRVQYPYLYPYHSLSPFGNSYGNLTSLSIGEHEGKSKNNMFQEVTGKNVGNEFGSGQDEDNVSNGPPVCSSSGVLDPNSSSPQGGSSCDSVTNSNHIGPDRRPPPVNNKMNGPDKTDQNCTDRSNTSALETRESSALSRQHSVAIYNGKPPKPQRNGNGNVPPFAQMPCVKTTGSGPEGKTVNGFLYRYSKSDISIVCVCHGRCFSPAEFVRHAGGTEVTHPLRHITVVPSAF